MTPATAEPRSLKVEANAKARLLLTKRMAGQLATMREYDPSEIGTLGGKWSWKWGYLGRGLSALYGATKQPEAIHAILSMRDVLMETRNDAIEAIDDFRGGILKTWGTSVPNSEVPGMRTAEIETTGLMLLPFSDLLLRVQNDLSFPRDLYEELLQMVVDGLEAHLPEVIMHEPSSGTYFISPWTRRIEPLNHSHLLGALAADAYTLTGREDFRHMTEGIYAFFKHNWFREEDGTVSWAYRPTPDDRMMDHEPMRYGERGFRHGVGAEFFYKAAITIELPVAMDRARILPDSSDIELIATSMHRNVFNRGLDVSYYISPRKIRLASDPERGRSILRPHHMCNFDLLTPYAPEIGRDIEALVEDATELLPKGWLSGPSGQMALAKRLAAESEQLAREDYVH